MSLSLLLLALAASAPAHIAHKAAFDLKGARLGMSLEQWRALPYPGAGQAAARAKPVCSTDPGADSPGLQLAADRQAGTVVCAYASRYGRYLLPEPVDLAPNYPTHRLRYVFKDDRLARIEFYLSVNAYDPLVGDLTDRYGPSAKLIRDTARTPQGRYLRVTQAWTTSGSTIEITDPVPPAYDLSLSFISTAPGNAVAESHSRLSPERPPGVG